MLEGKFSVEVRHDEISEKIGLKLKEFLLSSDMKEDKENPDYVSRLVETEQCCEHLISIWII